MGQKYVNDSVSKFVTVSALQRTSKVRFNFVGSDLAELLVVNIPTRKIQVRGTNDKRRCTSSTAPEFLAKRIHA